MYAYIFEDGTTQIHADEPTATDLEMIADGTLMVLVGEAIKYVDGDGTVDELTECEVGSHDGREFHQPS